MRRIETIEDLAELRELYRKKLKIREISNDPQLIENLHSSGGSVLNMTDKALRKQILICAGTGCRASESQQIVANFTHLIQAHQLNDQVQVVPTGCFGFCEKGPIVKMIPDNTFYVQVTPQDVAEIFQKDILEGQKVDRLLYIDPNTHEHIPDSKHINFYKKQKRIALRNCGFINPE